MFSARAPLLDRLELPTWGLAATIYSGWLALTYAWHDLPGVVAVPLAAWFIAWHGSFQHEAVHGHPTRSRRLNAVVAGVPLSLWLPFPIYRDSHLAHHRAETLTDPYDDPESYYIAAGTWRRLPIASRLLRQAMQTVLGRLLLGPFAVVGRFFAEEGRQLVAGTGGRREIWRTHALACAAMLVWVIGVCEIPLWVYVAAFVYPGLSLTLLRSFTEHRPGVDQSHRTAIVEAGPLLSLLYLHNNLHLVHHREPHLPWYVLPRRFAEVREALLADNGGFHFAGYRDIVRRYLVRRKDSPVHPGAPISCADELRPSAS